MLDHFAEIKANLDESLKSDKLHHAIMIAGPIGIGKFEFAKNLAAKILKLPDSKELENHPDFKIISKADGKKNISVDQIRKISSFFQNTSAQDQSKIVLIDSFEFLNISSSNAILKTLEEPNKSCHLIITCNNAAKILPTIKSRCQIYQLQSLSFEQFKTSFTKMRPSFLPPLEDSELLKLGILTNNSPGLAVKNGDDFLSVSRIITDAIANGYIGANDIKKACDLNFDFYIQIYNQILSVIIKSKYDTSGVQAIFQDNPFIVEKIVGNLGMENIINIFQQMQKSFAKVKNVYIDQKLVIINSINKLSVKS